MQLFGLTGFQKCGEALIRCNLAVEIQIYLMNDNQMSVASQDVLFPIAFFFIFPFSRCTPQCIQCHHSVSKPGGAQSALLSLSVSHSGHGNFLFFLGGTGTGTEIKYWNQ